MRRDIPILYSGPMVLALLREIEKPGTGKTMTRRLAWNSNPPSPRFTEGTMKATIWQNVKAGDRLWVRERLTYKLGMWWYAADDARVDLQPPHIAAGTAWADHYSHDMAPSIHMPRALSRIMLIVTAVKTEPLQMIRRRDIIAEGIPSGSPIEFTVLWESLHGAGSWNQNPAVIALTFTVHKQNIDKMAA